MALLKLLQIKEGLRPTLAFSTLELEKYFDLRTQPTTEFGVCTSFHTYFAKKILTKTSRSQNLSPYDFVFPKSYVSSNKSLFLLIGGTTKT